jgi:hypothetical protein
MKEAMAFEAILDEVDQPHSLGARLLEALLTIAGNVRTTATVLAVLAATKLQGGDGHTLTPATNNETRLISFQVG